MVNSKQRQTSSKKTKKTGATGAAARQALEQEVKDFFTLRQNAFQLAKKRQQTALKAAQLKSGGEVGLAETAAAFNQLAELADDHFDSDYVLIDPAGNVVPRQRVIADVRRLASLDEHKRSKHNVRVYGNTAVSVTQVSMVGSFEGHSIAGEYRETNLLVKEKGAWSITHNHLTLVRPMSTLYKNVTG